MTRPRRISLLGSTGSIGQNTVTLLQNYPHPFSVEALVAHRNVRTLIQQAQTLQPQLAVIADESYFTDLKEGLSGSSIAVAAGESGVQEAASLPTDWVMAAIVGVAGLKPTLTVLQNSKVVAFASKECLVCAGDLMMAEVKKYQTTLLPVDSEHSALFQIMGDRPSQDMLNLILTCSGGPFLHTDTHAMKNATPEQATQHPKWNMGQKISVDSATLMNKALEIIEAHYLFGVPEQQISVVIHPESIIHGMVEYRDGSILAAMSIPDMRIPIAYTLSYPERIPTLTPPLQLTAIRHLTFSNPDTQRFPALHLARQVLQSGGTAPTIFNAANEVAVQAFLERRIGFLDIVACVTETLSQIPSTSVSSLDDIWYADAHARSITQQSFKE